MKYGFITVASAVPTVSVADCFSNLENMKQQIAVAEDKGVEIMVFPELSVTGYSCQDLFMQRHLVDSAEECVSRLLDFTRALDVILIVGVPVVAANMLFNCAAVINHGRLIGIVPKTYLPNYGEFYEKRWFASAHDIQECSISYAGTKISLSGEPQLFRTSDGVLFGIEICEDLWSPVPPSNTLAFAGADIIFNLSASDELIGKHDYLKTLIAQQSARIISGYVYSGCGFGESTQDVVYGGNALIYENGCLLEEGARFQIEPQLVISQIDVEKLRVERRRNTSFIAAAKSVKARILECEKSSGHEFKMLRNVNPMPFIPSNDDMKKSCEEIFCIQVAGLAKRIMHTHSKNVILGISGGLDSTLALLVCVKTFDKLGMSREGIVGVTMPGFGTTDRTYNNAMTLMERLGITIHEINISAAVTQHFKDIGHDASRHDVTYENSQARERTQILMDLSNRIGGFVVGTGDLSELALGWATYNGDHMSMYGVNAGVPKTLIKYLVRYVAESGVDDKSRDTLLDIIDTPISPELIPADENGNIKQKTEDLVGPYELHDFFIYYTLRYGFSPSKVYMLCRAAFDESQYDDKTIKSWLKTFYRRFFNQQFKRSCLPDGPKVGSVSLSPRGDWRMPSDASSKMWVEECDNL